jgi:Ca-activated chloride channel family protein
MRFSSPALFWLLLMLVPLGLRVLATERFFVRLRRIFGLPPAPGVRWRIAGRCLLPLAAILSLVTALAGPRVIMARPGNVRQNIVLAIGVDVSKSMLAEDVVVPSAPHGGFKLSNRLNMARDLALEICDQLTNEQVGLFFFARNGIEVVAPTRDRGFLRYMVTHTHMADLTESGSNLLAALDSGTAMTAGAENAAAQAMILISDGEDTENSPPALRRGIAAVARRNIPVFTVGTGQTSAVHIPIRRKGLAGIAGFYTDADDLPLQTRLDERALRNIAAATGGRYVHLDHSPPAAIAENLVKDIVTQAGSGPDAIPEQRLPVDLAAPFLFGGLLFYCLYLLL